MAASYPTSQTMRASLLTLGLLSAPLAQAAKIDTSLAIAPSIVYTDNVCLTESNKKDDWIATVTPNGSIGAQGKKTSIRVTGFMTINSLTNSQLKNRGCGGVNGDTVFRNRNQYSPRVQAVASYNMFPGSLSWNASARWDENAFNSRLAGGDDPLNRRGNANRYFRYSVGPTYTTQVAKDYSLNARYKYDELINDTNKANDSFRHTGNLSFRSLYGGPFSWGLVGSATRTEYTNTLINNRRLTTTELQSVRIQMGYQVDRTLSVNGSWGHDWNNLDNNNRFDQGGNAWQVGFRWRPSRNTSIGLGMGDRFFGQTPSVDVSHQRKRNTFTLNFDKRIAYDRDLRTRAGGDLADTGAINSLQSRNPIIDERWTLGWTYSGRNAVTTLRGSHSEQTRTLDDSKGTFKDLGLTVTPYLSASYSVTFQLFWSEDEPRGPFNVVDPDINKSETWSTGLTLSKPINNRTSASLTWLYTERDAEFNGGNYEENRVVATINFGL